MGAVCSQEKKENPHKVPGALAPQPRPKNQQDNSAGSQNLQRAGAGTEATAESTQQSKRREEQQSQQRQQQHPAQVPEREGFVVAHHPQYGYLLLLTEKKGRHYQLPGGHVDASDGSPYASPEDVCKVGAVRKLYEKTGIDLRPQLGNTKHAESNIPVNCML